MKSIIIKLVVALGVIAGSAVPSVALEHQNVALATLPVNATPAPIETTIAPRTTESTRANRGSGGPRLSTTSTTQAKSIAQSVVSSSQSSSGLISLRARIGKCEGGGNYQNVNRSSGAGGEYQYLPSTWNGYDGYSRAQYAPPAVQDQRALSDLEREGTTPWNASRRCWNR